MNWIIATRTVPIGGFQGIFKSHHFSTCVIFILLSLRSPPYFEANPIECELFLLSMVSGLVAVWGSLASFTVRHVEGCGYCALWAGECFWWVCFNGRCAAQWKSVIQAMDRLIRYWQGFFLYIMFYVIMRAKIISRRLLFSTLKSRTPGMIWEGDSCGNRSFLRTFACILHVTESSFLVSASKQWVSARLWNDANVFLTRTGFGNNEMLDYRMQITENTWVRQGKWASDETGRYKARTGFSIFPSEHRPASLFARSK